MSRELPAGTVRFDHVSKEYVLGRPRAYLKAALPFGDGMGRGDRLQALKDVSFEIAPGEAFALIGANGAGKSTALKCLAGVTAPTSGKVTCGGRLIPLIELGIGFHPDLTGLENARFAATMAGLRGAAAQRAIEAAVAFSGVERFIQTPVKRYSSGMYARLSFGIAASLPADVLIVDEILSVGDVAFQRKCYAKLQELRSSGTTLLFVSHNEWVLKETCTRGVLLAQGQVVKEAPINDLLAAYQGMVSGDRSQRVVDGGTQRLHLRHVDLVDNPQRSVQVHQPMTVEVEVEVGHDAHEAVVGLAFADRERRLIWAAYSDAEGVRLPAGGTYRLRIEVPDLSVLPGKCLFEVLAFDRSSPVVEASQILELEVLGKDLDSNWEHGLVHTPSLWSLGEPVT